MTMVRQEDGYEAKADQGPLAPRSRIAALGDAAGAVVGTAMGVAPHVLHHVGILAGAALVTGATGNAVFFVVGLLFSIPLLRRIHRRFRTWVAPAIAVLVFAAMYSVSAFIIGPAINSASENRPAAPTPTPSVVVDEHAAHH